MSEGEKYRNREYAQPLDRKTLYRMVLRSCNLQGSYNFERMQSVGWLYAILCSHVFEGIGCQSDSVPFDF